MALTQALERQSVALIQQARNVLGAALRLDPQHEALNEEQLIARLESLRECAKGLAGTATGVRINAVAQRSRARRKALA